jgi:hypothetical protein
MKEKIPANQLRGLYGKLLCRLFELNQKIKKFGSSSIAWSYVYEKIGRNFSLKKPEIREALFVCRDFGYIDVSNKGIKLNYSIKND